MLQWMNILWSLPAGPTCPWWWVRLSKPKVTTGSQGDDSGQAEEAKEIYRVRYEDGNEEDLGRYEVLPLVQSAKPSSSKGQQSFSTKLLLLSDVSQSENGDSIDRMFNTKLVKQAVMSFETHYRKQRLDIEQGVKTTHYGGPRPPRPAPPGHLYARGWPAALGA